MNFEAGIRDFLQEGSKDFDAYLMIRGPGDFEEDNDDSGDDGTDMDPDGRERLVIDLERHAGSSDRTGGREV